MPSWLGLQLPLIRYAGPMGSPGRLRRPASSPVVPRCPSPSLRDNRPMRPPWAGRAAGTDDMRYANPVNGAVYAGVPAYFSGIELHLADSPPNRHSSFMKHSKHFSLARSLVFCSSSACCSGNARARAQANSTGHNGRSRTAARHWNRRSHEWMSFRVGLPLTGQPVNAFSPAPLARSPSHRGVSATIHVRSSGYTLAAYLSLTDWVARSTPSNSATLTHVSGTTFTRAAAATHVGACNSFTGLIVAPGHWPGATMRCHLRTPADARATSSATLAYGYNQSLGD